MLVFERESWRAHRPWALGCGLVVLMAAGAYTASSVRAGRPVGGSSGAGLVCGILAGLIILYECAFVFRRIKWLGAVFLRSPAQARLRRHIWIGLLCLPLALLHGGVFTRGSLLALGLLAVCLAVIASGIWGLLLQQRLPGRLLQEVPLETVSSQIPDLTKQLRGEASLLVLATCGPPAAAENHGGTQVSGALREEMRWVRAQRSGRGAGVLAKLPLEPIAGTEPLRDYFDRVITPFLEHGTSARTPLRAPVRAAADFYELRQKLNPQAHSVVDVLEELCERRRLYDRQARLQFWLRSWLWVHLPLSVALFVLLLWHAVSAFIYF